MKRSLALAALLLAASACTTTTDNTNTGAGNTNANANANAAATPATPAGPTQADIEAKEREVWAAIKAKSWDALGALLTDDFVLVSGDGVQPRAQMLEAIKKYDLTEFNISDTRLVRVSANLAVITYTSTEKSSYDGKPTPGSPVRSSTAWVNRGGKWLAAYHQETDVAAAPPAGSPTPAASPSPTASPAATPAASPAATPAAPATATDAEKQVWDAIRRRDYDAFLTYILPESLEVEPTGVYTPSESVAMLRQFDGSKFTQSDFKETKLDAEATLVTYTLTGPIAGKTVTEHHATIWTNRAGQWRAAFHQGSPHRAQ